MPGSAGNQPLAACQAITQVWAALDGRAAVLWMLFERVIEQSPPKRQR